MRLKTYFFLLLVSTSALNFSKAQDPNNTVGNVKIASPNTASLGKFVDIPVNYYTGVPGISIPVHTVKSGPLSLPIGLSYHAGGLKVQEQASWVGAGWSLNAGGLITRTVKGLPDEKKTGSQFQKYGYFSDYGYLSYLFKSDQCSGGVCADPNMTYLQTGIIDGEPDLFFFNFNGYSGKFYFNDDRKVVFVPEQDLKVEYQYTEGTWHVTTLGRCIEGFIITTPDGTRYYFGRLLSPPVAPFVDPIEVSNPFSLIGGSTYSRIISGWYLNKIVSPDGQSVITLNYEQDNYAYYTVNAAYKISASDYDLVKNSLYGVRLSRIDFSNGKVEFTPGVIRQDLCDQYYNGAITDAVNQSSPALGSIKVSDASGGTTICKKYVFSYDYFTDNSTAQPSNFPTINTDKKRLKLNSIQETTCDGYLNVPPYTFEYFPEPVPRSLCYDFDHWGYYNYDGVTHNSTLMPVITTNGQPTAHSGNANRETAWPAMRGGTLKKITFPTGGYTDYDFEANTFTVNNINKSVGGLRIKTISQYAGLPGETPIITTYAYNDFNSTYSSGILYGRPAYIGAKRNDLVRRAALNQINGCGYYPNESIQIYESPFSVRPMESTQGYHIGYGRVTVSQAGNGRSEYWYYGTEPWLVDHSKLATTNINTYYCDLEFPNYPTAPLPNDFKRGELKREGHYNEAGLIINDKEFTLFYQENPVTTPCIISVVDNGRVWTTLYSLKTARKTSSTVVEKTTGIAGEPPVETSTQTLFESLSHHQPTKIITTNSLGQTIEKRIKYANDFIASSISSYCDCNYQSYLNTVSSVETQFDQNLQTANCFANGVPAAGCTDPAWRIYTQGLSDARTNYLACSKTKCTSADATYASMNKSLKDNADGILKPVLLLQDSYMNPPIESSSWKNSFLLDASYSQYINDRIDVYGNYLDKSQKILLATPSTSFSIAGLNGSNTSIIKDSRYTNSDLFGFYKGNLTNYAKQDNIPTGYLWGYNGAFPIAKVVNAYNSIKEIAQPGTVNNSFNFQLGPSNPTSGNLLAYLNQTQTGTITVSLPGLPPNAQATATFTLTGPSNQSGYICLSGSGGPSCGGTPSSVSYFNMPPGLYTLSGSVNTTFQSYTFYSSLSYSYSGTVIVPSGNKEFFLENFEEYVGATNGNAHTGKYYHNTNYTNSFVPPNGRSYIIQWWNYSNAKWNFNSQAYTTNMVLTGPVDDVRIMPSDAFMNSYTYNPLGEMTSEIDPRGRTIFYVYDNLNRLVLIKDNDNNVIKKICYTYTGQTENCTLTGAPTFYNTALSQAFTRNNCTSGYIGSQVWYTVPANTYSSTISQADAQAQAQADINANGQGYANTNGTCIQAFNVIGNNSKNKVYTVTISNANYYYSFTLNAFANNITLGQVASGTYTVNISPQGSPITANFNVNGFIQTGQYYGFFSGIPITNTSTISVY